MVCVNIAPFLEDLRASKASTQLPQMFMLLHVWQGNKELD